MKRRYMFVLAALAVLLVPGLSIGPAQAIVTTTYTGTIDGSDPEMDVVTITDPNCDTQVASPVHYEVIEFLTPEPGTHDFTLTMDTPTDLSFYLYQDSFDPLDGETNCVAGINDGTTVGGIQTKVLSFDFEPNTPYFFVVFDDTFEQIGGDYELVVQSPDPPPPTTTTTVAPTTTAAPTTTTVARPAPVAAAVAARPAFTG